LLDRFWTRVRQRRTVRGFRSRFGGLWTDRLDALERLEEARRNGRMSSLHRFEENPAQAAGRVIGVPV
jgi:hypothetical protein